MDDLGAPASRRQDDEPAREPGQCSRHSVPSPPDSGAPRPSSDEWRSRGYLPHHGLPGQVQHVTFRLHDAVPAKVIAEWRAELRCTADLPQDHRSLVELRRRLDRYEDQGGGACWLADRRLAKLVADALAHSDGQRYGLLAWCVMPNHVHALIEVQERWPVQQVVQGWKSFTAHAANRLLKRTGAFWFREYHDRYIRNQAHLARVTAYIHGNPVAAGLVTVDTDWEWSSARRFAAASRTTAGGRADA